MAEIDDVALSAATQGTGNTALVHHRGNLFSLFKEQFKLNLSRNFILKNKQDENRLCPFFSRCRVSLPSCFPPGKKRDSLFISFD
jgi:hypothetical protein